MAKVANSHTLKYQSTCTCNHLVAKEGRLYEHHELESRTQARQDGYKVALSPGHSQFSMLHAEH